MKAPAETGRDRRSPAQTGDPVRLVLVGAGHAHLEVLRRLGERRGSRPLDLVLVSLADRQHYSGMVPGHLAGIYDEDELAVPLAPLVERAGGRLVVARATAVEPERRRVLLDSAPGEVGYDLVSFDVGSLAAGQERPDVARHVCSVKPIERVRELRRALVALARRTEEEGAPPARVVVVGGGAAGVEVAFAAARVLDDARRAGGGGRRVTIVEGGARILGRESEPFRRRALRALSRRSIHVETGRRVAEVHADRVVLDAGPDGARELPSDLTVWLTGPAAPPLFVGSGLALDERGFLLVGPSLRSLSDPRVFGAGDCVTLAHAPETPKAGVYAVREGPVLWESLSLALAGDPGEPPVYRPQAGFLALLNTCDGRALLSWRGRAAHGRWAWWLKDAIDRRFVRKYRRSLD